MGEIDTDTIGHDELGILGTNQLFLSKKSPTGTAVPMSDLKEGCWPMASKTVLGSSTRCVGGIG